MGNADRSHKAPGYVETTTAELQGYILIQQQLYFSFAAVPVQIQLAIYLVGSHSIDRVACDATSATLF
jgi:hypothetical protein